MAKIQQRLLAAVLCWVNCAAGAQLPQRRFYPDDPLQETPKPLATPLVKERKLSEYFDYFYNTFGKPGEHHTPAQTIPGVGVNTLGDVPDSTWFVNRHGRKRMSRDELVRGPGNSRPPSAAGSWRVVSAKTEGVTPGFTIVDAEKRRYLLKFDPFEYPELASGADIIGSKFFYALGYNTPENYVVSFTGEQLTADPKAKITDRRGVERPLRQDDINSALKRVRQDASGRYRALASLYLSGKPAGPFRYNGTRTDDPNDIYPHENRRDLRGLNVFAAWLNHTDTKSINSLDMLATVDGVQTIVHHLIDFGAILGSDSFMPKSPRNGNVFMFDWPSSAKEFFSLGLYVPRWARARYPDIPGVGNFEYEMFDPDKWVGNYYNPAFANMLPDDGYWAAKQLAAFTPEDIRAVVETAQYSDPRATDWVTRCIVERRTKILRTYYSKVLPVDRFRIENGQLMFDDLAVLSGLRAPLTYTVAWSTFNNQTGVLGNVSGSGTQVPPLEAGEYASASIEAAGNRVRVYVRRSGEKMQVVGVDRPW